MQKEKLSRKEELLLRALNTSNTTALQKEDLSELLTLVTPVDVKLTPRLGAVQVTALTHEWVESELDSTISHGKYTEGDLPSDNAGAFGRKSNYVMALGKVAKVTGLLQQVAIVTASEGKVADAFANEITNKMQDLIRTIEYYFWNGDHTANVDEMNGVLTFIPAGQKVNMASAALTEPKLREALKLCYAGGGVPSAIYCRSGVAIQIANFSEGKVQYVVNVNEDAVLHGGHKVMKYLSPLGTVMDVIPVRDEFLPSGNVVILQEEDLKKGWLSDDIMVEDIQLGKDNMAKLLKAYLTLEMRAPKHHALIYNVDETVN